MYEQPAGADYTKLNDLHSLWSSELLRDAVWTSKMFGFVKKKLHWAFDMLFYSWKPEEVLQLLPRQKGNWRMDKRFMKSVHESDPFRVKQGLNMSQIQENLGQRFKHQPFSLRGQRIRSQKTRNRYSVLSNWNHSEYEDVNGCKILQSIHIWASDNQRLNINNWIIWYWEIWWFSEIKMGCLCVKVSTFQWNT